jgi:hypothetical protein
VTSGTQENATFANLAIMFQRAKVIASKVEMKFAPDQSAGNVAGWAGMYFTDGNTYLVPSATNLNVIPQASRSRFITIPPPPGFQGYTPAVTMRMYTKLNAVVGQTSQQWRDSPNNEFSSNGSAWAAPASFGHESPICLFAMQSNDTTNTFVTQFDVVLTQYLEVYSRLYS